MQPWVRGGRRRAARAARTDQRNLGRCPGGGHSGAGDGWSEAELHPRRDRDEQVSEGREARAGRLIEAGGQSAEAGSEIRPADRLGPRALPEI